MAATRPTIEPALLASLIEAAPGRVRKRLDKEPDVAQSWDWAEQDGDYQVSAGEETVRISTEQGVVRRLEQITCSCLLAPKCHHILACVTSLAPADLSGGEPLEAAGAEEPAAAHGQAAGDRPASDPEQVEVTQQMRDTALRVRHATVDLLRVGARAAGSLLQSALLRAGHDCRVHGLPLLGNTVLRIAESTRRLRAQSDNADSGLLRQDLMLALLTTELLHDRTTAPRWVVGTNRREYAPVDVARLQGWFAEPILTRSGYAGVCVYLLAPDGQLYQVNELRPGDGSLVKQAYRGGIDLGAISVRGSELCRQRLMVQNLTAADDGRLGRGKGTRWAVQEFVTAQDRWSHERFARPLRGQLNAVFDAADQQESPRGGWDLVTFDAEIVGAVGPTLLAQVDQSAHPWRMRIALDDPQVAFRENLELLARCPGLPLRCVGRVRSDAAGEVELLAISAAAQGPAEPGGPAPPRLCLPDTWYGWCNLGLDRLERHHIQPTQRWGVNVSLDARHASSLDDRLQELDRRLTAVALGGYRALPNIESAAHRRAVAALRRQGHMTAAHLTDQLAAAAASLAYSTAAAPGTERVEHAGDYASSILAGNVYLRAARNEFHHQCWKQLLDA